MFLVKAEDARDRPPVAMPGSSEMELGCTEPEMELGDDG